VDHIFKLSPGRLRRDRSRPRSAVLLRALGPRAPAAQDPKRGVLRHGVQPGTQRSHLRAALENRVRVDERILDGLFGVRVANDAGTVPEQLPSVAMDDGLEGRG
jgi:hypothetical protein